MHQEFSWGNRVAKKMGRIGVLGVLVAALGRASAAPSTAAPTNDVVATLVGTVVPGHLVLVCPKVPGQVARLLVEPGALVKAGDLLAELEAAKYKLELERLEARVAVAKAQVQEAKTEPAGAARLAVAEANLRVAEAEFRLGEYGLAATQIRAPIEGTILSRQADVGLMVDSGRSVTLFEMADLHDLAVAVNVPENLRDFVFPGQACRIQRQGSTAAHKGSVLRLCPGADLNTGTYSVQVKFEEKGDSLRPGCVVSVEFLSR